ncbi:hypothetical protein [Moorena producens]|uniref:hypothetical protein n=1 Tax=Moorena producens TaxID=1155739 RepID=UPI00131448F8|nr:hypothetical protein [Moorena producens]
MSRWCVTGRTIPTLALEANNKGKSAPNAPYWTGTTHSLLLTPYSLLPTPYSLLPTP